MLALRKLIRAGKISMAQYCFGIWTETLKYPVRLLRVSLRTRAAMWPLVAGRV
jgi:hypothetical protein